MTIYKNEISKQVHKLALECGYEKCGIIDIEEVNEYKDFLDQRIANLPETKTFYEEYYGFANMRKFYPKAKSIIVCGYWYGKYKVPPQLKEHYGRSYLMDGRINELSDEYKTRCSFETGLESLGIRFQGNRIDDIAVFRLAAYKAGIGIIRKNNFLYTGKGSWIYLDAWVVENDLEAISKEEFTECPPNCNKCQKACKTEALCKPNTMNPYKCTSFISTLNAENIMKNPLADKMKTWIYGCDDCQNACPFNRNAEGDEEFPQLEQLEEHLTIESIIKAEYEDLSEFVQAKFWYIEPYELWKFKVNALNALKNSKAEKKKMKELLAVARKDRYKEVRDMAEWIETL